MRMIYRYLVTASALLLMVALAASAWYYNRQATQDLVAMAVKHNLALDRLLSNAIWGKYGAYLALAREFDAEALKGRPETAKIDAAVRSATEGVGVLKVKIYSPDGTTLFSTDAAEIGEDYSESDAFQTAVREGEPSSELSYEHQFTAFSGESFERDVVETYLPRFNESGEVIAVVEVYVDVTEMTDRINATTFSLLGGLILVFGATYLVLAAGIMRRAIEPVRLASDRAVQIGPAASNLRLPTDDMPKEILPLVLAINDALDRLERALESQQRFAADAAHEMLTPLAVLRAQIYSLDDETIAGPLRQEIDAMSDIVNQLLFIAELDAQAGDQRAEHADLVEVTTDVVSSLAPVAVREGKELALTGAREPIVVKGSVRMLSRALGNLVKNAIRHTPEGSTVEIDLSPDGRIQVIDRGEGVPPEKREKIFDRFWRGGDHNEIGAGLGLAIVKGIVDNLGAQISVDDAPGGGARFTINLEPADASASKD